MNWPSGQIDVGFFYQLLGAWSIGHTEANVVILAVLVLGTFYSKISLVYEKLTEKLWLVAIPG